VPRRATSGLRSLLAHCDRPGGRHGTTAFVALRSPRRGRVARRSPSIAIVGRRLLGRFLLGGSTRRAGPRRTLASVVMHKRGHPPGAPAASAGFTRLRKAAARSIQTESTSRSRAKRFWDARKWANPEALRGADQARSGRAQCRQRDSRCRAARTIGSRLNASLRWQSLQRRKRAQGPDSPVGRRRRVLAAAHSPAKASAR
jgi:hypothetical protein